MIQCKDLRFGNTVLFKDIKTGESKIINIRSQTLSIYTDEWFDPIPLTEEWLVKFGFVKGDTTLKYGNGHDYQPKDVYTTTTLYKLSDQVKYRLQTWTWTQGIDNEDSLIYYDSSIRKCDYVHQLQNLYFALTGEELIYTV